MKSLLPLLLALGTISANAEPIDVLPVRSPGDIQSLNGDWSFKYLPGTETGGDADFLKPEFDVSSWKKIPVPANWELHGFAEPKYALEVEDGTGLYRRTFRLPAGWQEGRRVYLRLEGVAFGFEVWVNGKEIGKSSASAYNPHTFDITTAMLSDAANVLAVKVITKPLGYEFDVNDDWALSGIFRDVTLFSVPDNHLKDVGTRTRLAADGAAELSVTVKASTPGAELRGKLLSPDGSVVKEFDITYNSHESYEAVVKVAKPQLWTAETPALYRLQLTLSDKGRPLQTIEESIGLREISIKDGILLLNGRPIKLRGANHHDISPEHGRAITVAEMRQDLELMRKGNINFVRTSHYPPNERFIELCDEMGFYVMDEVSIGKGEEHLNKASHRGNILARVEPTITRDKNHASVIIWSIGNENPIADSLLDAGRLAKELDPTRPICYPTIGSYFEKNYDRFPDFVDIYAPHYPVNSTLKRYARDLKRPTILTEYAHALGLATDRIQSQWEILQANPVFAGGSVWMFQDQGILRKSNTPVDRSKPTPYVWKDADHYYDTSGDKGADGVVYSDRTPQSDYWQLRKVYAPVRIAERSATVKPGDQEISLTLENRYDFRSLGGMKLTWSLRRNGADIQNGVIAPTTAARATESLRIPISIPADTADDVLALDIRCLDGNGNAINERSVRLDPAGSDRSAWISQLPAAAVKLTESDSEVRLESPRWTLTVTRADGGVTLRNAAGQTVVAGIHPHAGRHLTMAEALSSSKSGTWTESAALKPSSCEVKASRDGDTVRISVSGTYPRPAAKAAETVDRSDDPLFANKGEAQAKENKDEALVGGYQMEILPSGAISIRYDYQPRNVTGRFTEAGLAVALPAGASEFRWIGQGIHPGYPGKDQLNEFGIFHLTRDDLRFQGNRRETELALVTTPAGAGAAVLGPPADIAVERAGDLTLLSHNAVISGLGNKGGSPESAVSAEKTAHISGSFTLVPLEDTWPAALTRWFGRPAAAKDVFKPFHHSYDQ